MNDRFKIKFDTGKVLGPLSLKQIGILYVLGHLNGNEHYQQNDSDRWAPVTAYFDILSYLEKIIKGEVSEEEILSLNEREIINKIMTTSGIEHEKAVNEIDKTKKLFQEFKFKKEQSEISQKSSTHSQSKSSENIDKTVLKRDFNPKELQFEKTKLAEVQVPFQEDTSAGGDGANKELDKEEVPIQEKINIDDKTEIANIKDLLPKLKVELKETEKEVAALQKVDSIETTIVRELTKIKTIVKKIPKNKKTKWITAVAFFVVFYVLLFPEDDINKEIKLIYPEINFPAVNQYVDKAKAIEAFELGKKEYEKNTYESKVSAAKHFEVSLRNMFRDRKTITIETTVSANVEDLEDNNSSTEPPFPKEVKQFQKEILSPAVYWLIIVYSEIYNNSKNKSEDANTIFRLLQIANTKTITEEKAALGAGIFYSKIGKYKTAAHVMEKYVLMASSGEKKKVISNKFLAYRLHILTKAGMIGVDPTTGRNDAEETFQYLMKQKSGSLEMYIFCAEYLELNQRFKEAQSLLIKASTKYGKSAWLIIKYSEYAIRDKNMTQLNNNLKALVALNVEGSPEYYAKFLEYQGLLLISQKKFDIAAKFFMKSLKLNESDELRSRLAELELKGNEFEKFLILESKIKELLKTSEMLASNNKWEEAFKYAVEAADASANYIPSNIWLAKIQIKKGYYYQAIGILEKLIKIYPTNSTVNINLISAYVDANLIDKALQKLTILSQESQISNDPAFYSLLGRAYVKSGKYSIGIRYIKKGLLIHKMNDEDYYFLAKLFLEFGQVVESKKRIGTALMLQPDNLDYICFYAQLLYESDGADVAIGYLRNEMRERGESVKLLGQIAIFYYQSGQTKLFDKTKGEIAKLGTEDDPSLYKFLLKTAEMDGNLKGVVEYARKISILEPGDMDNKIKLASTYLDLKRYPEGHEVINDVLERMPTYKMANYYKAKLHLVQGEFNEALTSGASESLYFPSSEFGFLIQGKALQELANQETDLNEKARKLNDSTKFFENAVSRNRDSIEALKSLGAIKYRQGQYEIAREYYLRVWNIDKTDPDVNKQLGYVYKQIGQGDLAIEYFKNYLDLFKDAPDRAMIEEEMSVLR